MTSFRFANRGLYGGADEGSYVCLGMWLSNEMYLKLTPTVVVKFIIAWPIAKLLEFTLGPHHGIVYRKDGKSIIE